MKTIDLLKKILLLLALFAALVPAGAAEAVCVFGDGRTKPMAAQGMACCGGEASTFAMPRLSTVAAEPCRCETRVRAVSAPVFPGPRSAPLGNAGPALLPTRPFVPAPALRFVYREPCPNADAPPPCGGARRSERSRAPPLR